MNQLRKTATIVSVALLLSLLFSACRRKTVNTDDLPATARVHVNIDWSASGIDISSQNEAEKVDHVSIRFFPEDGSPAFDRYVVGNVVEGWIDVPIGKYSVVAFNESVQDAVYWSDAIFFTDVDSYTRFAAHAVVYDPAQRAVDFPFYTPRTDENVIIGPEPRKLVSWSLDHFEITEKMALLSNSRQPLPAGTPETAKLEALTQIRMRPLTQMVTVTARVTNLVSVHANYCSLSGLANTVYMASGEIAQTSATRLFQLTGRQYDSDQTSGLTRRSFLTFGPVASPEACTLAVDVVYITGERYFPDPPLKPELTFDVTSQMVAGLTTDIHLNVNYSVDYRKGGVAVNDWDDDIYVLR